MQGQRRTSHAAAGSPHNRVIGLDEVLGAVWNRRRSAFVVGAAVFATMSLLIFLDQPVYRAYVTLAPTRPPMEPNQVSLTEELIGIGLGSPIDVDVSGIRTSQNEAFATLNSRSISRLFIESEGLMPILFAKEWDAAAGKWKPADPNKHPSIDDAVEMFEREIRYISKNDATGFIRINIEWTDPELAATWANRLVELTDEVLRERDIREAQDSIQFLQEQAKRAPLESVKQLIYALVESYSKTIMLARVKDNYVFSIIDPATAPRADEPVNMPVSFRLSLAFLFALGCGLLYVSVTQVRSEASNADAV
jgi:uncharacterized protein involved in exopolysaccharide biosynthesis